MCGEQWHGKLTKNQFNFFVNVWVEGMAWLLAAVTVTLRVQSPVDVTVAFARLSASLKKDMYVLATYI
jgi:hypothetical protein